MDLMTNIGDHGQLALGAKVESDCEKANDGLPTENKENRPCDPCLFDDVQEHANSFCVVCVEYLCKGCARDHRRSKATRNHKVLIDADIPVDPKLFKMMKSLVSCPDHPEMEVSYKCKTHKKFICTKCLVVSHRKCDEVIEISGQSEQPTETYTLLPNKLQSVYEMTVSVRNAKEDNVQQLRTKNYCIFAEMSEYVRSLYEQLRKLHEKCICETKGVVTKSLQELEKDIHKCKEIEEKEIQQKLLLDVAFKYGNSTEVSIISDKVEKDIKIFKDETTRLKEKAVVSLNFDRNRSFEEINSIGSVHVIKGNDTEYNQGETSRKETVIALSSDELGEKEKNVEKTIQCKSFMQSSVSKRRILYDIQSTTSLSDYKCSITSLLIMCDGRIALTDYSNERIKILNKDFTVWMEKELYGKPVDMCQPSKTYLAIILDGEKSLRKYFIDNMNLSYHREFPCKFYPVSIGNVTAKEDEVVILFSKVERPKRSDNNQIVIQIRSMINGKVLQTISEFRNNFSLKMVLDNPRRIRMIVNTFLISEEMRLRRVEVDKLNLDIMKEIWYFKSYQGDVLAEITDIAADREGNIYVCGKGSKNIHQISASNYMKNRVLLTVSGTPLSLCVDDDNRQLIIGCENDNFIYIIKLE